MTGKRGCGWGIRVPLQPCGHPLFGDRRVGADIGVHPEALREDRSEVQDCRTGRDRATFKSMNPFQVTLTLSMQGDPADDPIASYGKDRQPAGNPSSYEPFLRIGDTFITNTGIGSLNRSEQDYEYLWKMHTGCREATLGIGRRFRPAMPVAGERIVVVESRSAAVCGVSPHLGTHPFAPAGGWSAIRDERRTAGPRAEPPPARQEPVPPPACPESRRLVPLGG